jgi:hypothetical protein
MNQEHAPKPATNGHESRYALRLVRAVFLPVCLIAALVYLAPGVLPATAPSEPPEEALLSLGNLFPFDAPAWTAAVFKAGTEESRQVVARITPSAEEVVVADDWSYTAIVRGRPRPSKKK